MRDYGIDKGLIEFRDDSKRDQRGWGKGFFGFRKMFRDYLTKLNVPFFDACCPALTGDIYPVRYNDDDSVLERYSSDGEWVPIENQTNESFTNITVDNIGSSGDITVTAPLKTDTGIINDSGLIKMVPFISLSGQTNIVAGTGGAIPVTSHMTTIATDAGGDAFTLADGTTVGQTKKIQLIADGGGDATITPANLNSGTTITMNDVGDYVLLIWGGAEWFVVENIGSTVA